MRKVGLGLVLMSSAHSAFAQAPPSRKHAAPPRDETAMAAPAPDAASTTELPSRRHARTATPKPMATKPRGAPRAAAAPPKAPASAPVSAEESADPPAPEKIAAAQVEPPATPEPSPARDATVAHDASTLPFATVTALPPTSPAPAPMPPLEATPSIARPWYELVDASAFLDAYASMNPRDPRPDSPAAAGIGGNSLRAYDVHNGFALSWVGLNGAVAPEPVGGTVQLRFGPSASIHNATDAAAGLVNVKQAFASVKVRDTLTVDVGKFDQPLGSETADSQLNISYTRSFLYAWAQPLFFTGVRADYLLTPRLDLKLVVANGWNQSLDVNRGKSFGGQLTWTPVLDRLSIYAGYIGGPEQPDSQVVVCAPGQALDAGRGICATSLGAPGGRNVIAVEGANARWRHLTDLVVDWKPDAHVRLLANGDYGSEDLGGGTTARWYGGNLAGQWTVSKRFAVGARGEYFCDADGAMTASATKTGLASGTLTLSWSPSPHLLLRFENRADLASRDAFRTGTTSASAHQVTSLVGLVVTTSPLY